MLIDACSERAFSMIMIRRIFEIIISAMIILLVSNYFAAGGAGYLPFSVHPYIYYGVLGAALFVPLFWAVMHMCGGMLFGIAAGGILDGLRLGFTLGIGMALGKCWPYVLATGIGIYLGGGPLSYAIICVVAAVLLFALDRVIHYFWKSTSDGHDLT